MDDYAMGYNYSDPSWNREWNIMNGRKQEARAILDGLDDEATAQDREWARGVMDYYRDHPEHDPDNATRTEA